MKKQYYFIPQYGLIKMMIKPYETNDTLFAILFIFWQLITSAITILVIGMSLKILNIL